MTLTKHSRDPPVEGWLGHPDRGGGCREKPSWTAEQLYQHTRRMVISEIQEIAYNEFLPAILGANTPAANALQNYRGYRADVNPGIATKFSTAAFRLGHSMLGEDIQFLDNNGNPILDEVRLKDAFFDPRSVSQVGIDPLLKYLASDAVRAVQNNSLVDVIRRNTQLTNLQPEVFFFRTSIGGNVFADGNRDGVRQVREGGVAGTTVTLVTAAGATVATTRSDARGNYSFRGIDLGSFRVVVTPPGGTLTSPEGVKSRVVAITRGMDVRDVHVGLPPKPAAPATKQPPVSQPPARSPLAAAFAGIAASQPTALAPTKPRR